MIDDSANLEDEIAEIVGSGAIEPSIKERTGCTNNDSVVLSESESFTGQKKCGPFGKYTMIANGRCLEMDCPFAN